MPVNQDDLGLLDAALWSGTRGLDPTPPCSGVLRCARHGFRFSRFSLPR